MTYSPDTVDLIMRKFGEGRLDLKNYSMEVVGDVNPLKPLSMIRHYEAEFSVDEVATLAAEMLSGKELRFTRAGVEVARMIIPSTGDLNAPFEACPYLLDICLKYCKMVLLKNLTAPLPDSETSTRQSEMTE